MHLLHEQVEKVLFLWGGGGVDDPLEIDTRNAQELVALAFIDRTGETTRTTEYLLALY